MTGTGERDDKPRPITVEGPGMPGWPLWIVVALAIAITVAYVLWRTAGA